MSARGSINCTAKLTKNEGFMAQDLSDTELYPMRVVSRVTGLPGDTIRAWERRYAAVEPRRTAGNARRYSGADIRKLSLLRTLTEQGQSIGEIASLDRETLETLLSDEDGSGPRAGAPTPTDSLERLRADYFRAVGRMDTARASRLLFRAAAVLDNRELVFDLVVPLVQEIGSRWEDGSLGIAQEHFVSAELRSLLWTRMRAQRADPGAPRIVVATPAGFRHEFGILAAAMLANGRGLDVLYLGADLPDDDLLWAVESVRPSVLVLGVARSPTPVEMHGLEETLSRVAAASEVWLGCPAHLEFAPLPKGVRVFHALADFDVAIAGLRR
jgi:DNA-binding transcriptional MerR regulator